MEKAPDVGLVVIDGIRDLMLNINNSTNTIRLVDALKKGTDEWSIHLHTVLHLNKGDYNVRVYIGAELNNKAECVLQFTKDSIEPDLTIVAPVIIRLKSFDKLAFRLIEQADDTYLSKVNATYVKETKITKHFLYQELTDEQH